MAADTESLRTRIREVLLTDWDPHGATREPAASRSYDVYIDPLLQLLRRRDEDAVVEFLHEREAESMCFPSLGTQRLRRVARKLLAIQSEVAL